jgi:hypothetical protein
MNKLKLSSRRKVFKKFGYHLTVKTPENKTVELKLEKSLPRISKFNNTNPSSPYRVFDYSIRTKGILNARCVICDTDENVEMHHRRPLKN